MSSILKIRLILFTILGLTVLFLLYKTVVPFGEITYSWQACKSSSFITKLTPKDRVQGKCFNIIKGEPAYFNLNTPRKFDEAEVKVSYINNSDKNIVELGIQADEQKHYKLMPLENKIIDDLITPNERAGQAWDFVEQNGVYLWQKNPKFKSVDEFLAKLPLKQEVLTYHYDLPKQKTINNFVNNNVIITQSLRGAHQFYTYINDNFMEFEFLFSDLNINKEKDDIKIWVYDSNNVPVMEREIIDTREEEEESRQKQDVGGIHLTSTSLQPGFYKIILQTTDDIVTEQIYSSQKIVSFINKIRLADTIDENLITIFTDVSQVGIGTMNPAGQQKVLLAPLESAGVNEEVLNINETYRTFHAQTNAPISKLQFAKDDLIISGSGVFSFSKNSLYNPDYKKMSGQENLENINYIITTYQPQNFENQKQERTVKFDLTNMYRENGTYSFIFSIPGLLHDNTDDFIEVEEIEVELKGKSLKNKISSFLSF